MAVWRSLSRLVALPHSVFALPFALASLLLSMKRGVIAPMSYSFPSIFVLVILAVVFARTAAMAFNRAVDAKFDALNPRTANREIPKGIISAANSFFLALVSSAGFFLASAALGPHCLKLAPFVLAILLGYSFTKRFTTYAHFVLGLSLALAPGGAWWVFRPAIELTPVLIMLAVLCWVAGFDLLYSCQDVLFDRAQGIFSLPAKLGIETSLNLAKVFHVACLFLLFLTGLSAGLSAAYFVGVMLLSIPLLLQHRIIRPNDLGAINQAFFTFNGCVSVCYLLIVIFVCR